MKIQIISGSARMGSMTKRVALHLYDRLAENASVDVGLIDMQDNHLLPVEDVWSEPGRVPKQLRGVANDVFAADAFVLVSPEYNGSFSPALKNFLDHFPKQERKVFGIVTASPGSLGGIRAALQLQSLVFALSGIGSPRMLIVPEVDKKFGEDGTLTDDSFQDNTEAFLKEFLWLSVALTTSRKSEALQGSGEGANKHVSLATKSNSRIKIHQKAVSLVLGIVLAIGLGFSHLTTIPKAGESGRDMINQMMSILTKIEAHKVYSQTHAE